ncbi:hypothetical protein [Polaromonas sp.]|uniref:hypothetical protein n=1 Tax=Polaromonas sp. TaxID=1869339 RepID=UPI003CC6B00A
MTFVQSANEYALRNPGQVVWMLPWFLLMLPLVCLPSGAANWPWAKELVSVATDWIPMINSMSSRAVDPQWTRFALSCLWVSGPFWTLVAAICGIRTLKAKLYKQEPLGFSYFLKTFLVFGGAILVIATMKPRPWKRVDMLTYFFAERFGLFVVGWFFITSMFVVLGLIAALPLSRLFGYKYD